MKKTKEDTKKPRLLLRFFLILLVLTVSAAAVMLALKNGFTSKTGELKQISFDVNADNLYSWIEGGLVIASGTGVQLISEGGETVIADTFILQNPAIKESPDMAAVWSVGSKDFYTVNKANGSVKTVTEKQVINVYINSENWLAVSAQESGYKGAVNVYNNKLKPVYKWSSGEGYLIDAAISDSSSKLAALTINESGSEIHFFNLNSTEQKGSYKSQDKVLFDLAFINNSSLCALSSNSAVFINDRGSLISSYDFTDGFLKDYSFDGSGFAAIVVGNYKAGNSGKIVTLSPSGTLLGELEISSEILSFSVKGKYIAVLFSDSLIIYKNDMKVLAKVTDIASVRQIQMRPDGSVIMLSNSGAAVYKP